MWVYATACARGSAGTADVLVMCLPYRDSSAGELFMPQVLRGRVERSCPQHLFLTILKMWSVRFISCGSGLCVERSLVDLLLACLAGSFLVDVSVAGSSVEDDEDDDWTYRTSK